MESCPRPIRHFYIGLPLRDIVLSWKHKSLILFKLFLLQKRVIMFGSPVRRMCQLIISIVSLIPRLLEKGFQEVACVRTSRPLSPMPEFKQETAAYERESCNVELESDSNLNEDENDALNAQLDETETLAPEDDSSSAEDVTQASQSQSHSQSQSDSLTREASVDNLVCKLIFIEEKEKCFF